MSAINEYGDFDALGLAELVRNRDVSAEELLEEAIRRAEEVNPALNAIIHPLYERARQTLADGVVDGPFAGVPFLIKDLLADFEGTPLSNGSRFYDGYISQHDSELVARFRRAGLVIFGKTNTPEYGLIPVTEPERWGATLNPWNTQRTPGGSSGGSGAAVAARIVPMASGGDGGGSIRIPSSCCGLVGLKVSRGRNPTGPSYGDIWYSATVEGVLTRSVRDAAAALDATAGPDAGAPHFAPPPERPFLDEVGREPGKLRIAWSTRPMLADGLDAECVRGAEKTAKLLESLGHHVEHVDPPLDRDLFVESYLVLLASATAADITADAAAMGRRPSRSQFEDETWSLAKLGRVHSAEDVGLALRRLARITRQMGAFMQDYDVLLTPTLSSPPVPIGALRAKGADKISLTALAALPVAGLFKHLGAIRQLADQAFNFIPFTPVANITGEPSISLPLHWSEDNLPVGMMFTAKLAQESTLIRLAAQLEQAQPWADRAPPLIATPVKG